MICFFTEPALTRGAPILSGYAENVETFFVPFEKARVTNVVATPLFATANPSGGGWGVYVFGATRPKRRTAPWLQGVRIARCLFEKLAVVASIRLSGRVSTG